ncbi:MAG: hypothetical protein SO001_01015 [Alloprevotella sp.]|nr:hypothetical protein [Bacteroidales bacterium]MDY3731649.1 hypothetical protein [Alloprevotella sp.]
MEQTNRHSPQEDAAKLQSYFEFPRFRGKLLRKPRQFSLRTYNINIKRAQQINAAPAEERVMG